MKTKRVTALSLGASSVLFALLLGGAAAHAALLDIPWSGGGTGTTTLVSDGTSPPAEFRYLAQGPFSGSWSFGTLAGYSRTVILSYEYSGYHSWYRVTVGLDAISGGDLFPIVSAGPVNCCTSPSGGFFYKGTIALPVRAGESYGFLMRGSHYDSAPVLNGTLIVDELGKDACKAGGWKNITGLTGEPLFKNQGDCVSFVETGGLNDPGQNLPK